MMVMMRNDGDDDERGYGDGGLDGMMIVMIKMWMMVKMVMVMMTMVMIKW